MQVSRCLPCYISQGQAPPPLFVLHQTWVAASRRPPCIVLPWYPSLPNLQHRPPFLPFNLNQLAGAPCFCTLGCLHPLQVLPLRLLPPVQEWPRFSDEPFRRWLHPDWPAHFTGLWHGYYLFRNQGALGAPDPAMHLTIGQCERARWECGWGYLFSGTGDDGVGNFSIKGTIGAVSSIGSPEMIGDGSQQDSP